MTEEIYFASTHSTYTPSSPSLPTDDFTAPPLTPNTIFYLATIAPHTDTHTITGPVTTFTHLLPAIERTVNDSPSAIDKLDALRTIEDVWGDTEANHDFEARGFTTFIVKGQRGTYTVLQILREDNADVFANLPCPVYTITTHGPLSAEGKGYVGATELVGSWVERKDARDVAERCMVEMLEGEEGVKRSEDWGVGGKGAGILMGMTAEKRWEVRIAYEDQVLKRAKEGMERKGEYVVWRL
ncbi:hypothetical protein BDU57DRAFT_46989 [Ampelomyces quisqualis]|uniref:Uncharacterized protein n=1 Tax=Ampelomyces quisqualis TaxID=50730 RepID=A0A6A5R0Z8_AMPQU|nr:hypothetical protein BDU57DRAFT_46989 [Ampelomyces quisqualis]